MRMACAVEHLWLLLMLGVFADQVSAKVFTLQTDFQRNKDNHPIWDLSKASNGKALILAPDSILSLNFCLRKASDVSIADFRFANANKSETVVVEIDGTPVGVFTTPSTKWDVWDNFMSTGRFPLQLRNLALGWHHVYVKFNGTADGIAVDKIDVDVSDQYLNEDIFSCELTCIGNQKFTFRNNAEHTELSFAVQESYKTKCPEVDNINVPIFNPYVTQYEITAALPKYRTFSNWRHENTTGCPHLSPVLWTFHNVELTEDSHGAVREDKATLSFAKGRNRRARISLDLSIMFELEGKSKGMQDADIGSHLKLKFRSLPSEVTVTMSFKGKAVDMSHPVRKVITRNHTEAIWNIADFSWTELYYNFIVLKVDSNSPLPLHIDTLLLERRPMLPDTTQTIHKDDNVIVEAIFSDLWWLAPETMSLSLPSGHTYNNVSYFRIYRPIPWNSGYAQVFVLYQDGNSRLLPVPPEGVDWIPFGSSVIIGQSDPTVVRPYASIKHVTIDTENLVMELSYYDGGYAKLTLHNTMTETRVVVSDLYFTKSRQGFPFTTFRSMYVTEGNADVDHLSVNGLYSRHIMNNFGAIMGRSFVFHRRCMSRHLNLSPDIYIDIRRTSTDNEAIIQLLQSIQFQVLLQRMQNNRVRMWTPRL